VVDPLQLLVIEDSADDAELILRQLRRGGVTCEATRVQTFPAVREILAAGAGRRPDAVICDYNLPGYTAIDVLDCLNTSTSDIPLLVVTNSLSEEVAVACMRAGAADYLVKDRLTTLSAAVSRSIAGAESRRRHRAAERALTESETRFRQAFDGAPVGAALISLEPARRGDVIRVNAALCALTGFTERQLLGIKSWQMTHPADRDPWRMEVIGLSTARSERVQREIRLIRADSRVIWVRMTSSVVRRDGHPWYAVTHVEDVTARKHAEAELARRALIDPLTSLPNRLLLTDRLRAALRTVVQGRGAVGVVYLDLDHFKDVNDTFGHEIGDRLLTEIGRRLGVTSRPQDTPGRIGGDEFVVICPQLEGDAEMRSIAAALMEALDAPLDANGARIRITASMGLALTDHPQADAERLLNRADAAMYEAKRRGRHRVEMFHERLEHAGARRMAMQDDLRDALEHGWLRLYFQPVIDLTTERIVSAEALLRVEHPRRGLVGASEFIEVAEDSDLIVPIGAWVLTEACAQLARWRQIQPLEMAINVSGRQASNLAVSRQVIAAATAAQVPLADLCLEMTERVLIDASEAVVADLRVLTDNGVKLAIDDFGTGYSSLTYLQRFPVDTVKIDRSFIAGLGVQARDDAIVGAVIALADALDLTVVAEGVEQPAQSAQLRALGCHRAQGFHFARPLAAEEFTTLLLRAQEPPIPAAGADQSPADQSPTVPSQAAPSQAGRSPTAQAQKRQQRSSGHPRVNAQQRANAQQRVNGQQALDEQKGPDDQEVPAGRERTQRSGRSRTR